MQWRSELVVDGFNILKLIDFNDIFLAYGLP